MPITIGIDFDNTLIDYTHLFYDLTLEKGLIPSGIEKNKTFIRDWIRRLPQGEIKWQQLQAQVYGREIMRAKLPQGVVEFFESWKQHDPQFFIISHKTHHAKQDPDGPNLREQALAWMRAHSFFVPAGFHIPQEHVFFESTRQEKIARIHQCGCTYFIDDLLETFLDTAFPPKTGKIFYSPGGKMQNSTPDIITCESWQQITNYLEAAGHGNC